MGTSSAVRSLLEERPDLKPAIEAVLEPDPPFAFDDLDLDSGAFGELVARGIVERTEGGYRVPDADVVRRELEGGVDEGTSAVGWPVLQSLSMSRLEVVYLAGAIGLVVALRMLSLPTVYHGSHVVLSSNDPYYYRYFVERMVTDPQVMPSSLDSGVAHGEPLLVTGLWAAALLFGGSVETVGHVMAWYPVASAAITALLGYAVAVVVTDDRRIGLAAVVMLAVIPAHAFRTSLGFADHHAFDYMWLMLTLLALAVVAREGNRDTGVWTRGIVGAVGLIAIGVGGQTLAWDNSPIILASIGGYLGLEGLRSVHSGGTPRQTVAPVVTGITLGAILAWVAHDSLGWHTTLVTSAPALLALSGVGVFLGAVLVDRLDLPAAVSVWGSDPSTPALAVLELIGLIAAGLALRVIRPDYWARLTTSVTKSLLAPRRIAEGQGLFSQAGGWLLLLGFALFIGVPYLVWATSRSRTDGRWLPPVSYAWYFLLLSVIQVRFVGELAPVLALFVGLGVVHIAERIDVARPPIPFTGGEPPELSLPTRGQFGSLALLFLLVGSLGMVQVPVKTSQVTVSAGQSDAAFWMAEYSNRHGMEYPENYVFSEWGWNRMYNYFVSGESRSYTYARANFQSFVTSTDPARWYSVLDNRRGFVVTTPDDVGEPRELGTRLQRDNGAGSQATEALVHYRLVDVADGGDYKVFTVVPGAVIRGTGTPNETVNARTDVAVGDVSFTYVRRSTGNANGGFSIRVAQPGTYRVGGTTARVNTSAVRNGLTVRAK